MLASTDTFADFEFEEVKNYDPEEINWFPPPEEESDHVVDVDEAIDAAALAAQVEKQMLELSGLLTKLKANKATKEEMNQVLDLSNQINIVSNDMAQISRREDINQASTAEISISAKDIEEYKASKSASAGTSKREDINRAPIAELSIAEKDIDESKASATASTDAAKREDINQAPIFEFNSAEKNSEESKAKEFAQKLERLEAMPRQAKFELRRSLKEKEMQDVIQTISSAESVDLAFVIDATFSMQPHINNVQKSMKEVVNRIKKTNADLSLRLAVVAYRDLCCKKRYEVLDFGGTMGEFDAFLKALDARGGGDAPEDMAGGIQKANKLSWSNPTRIVFLVADAPCHGTEFHGVHDNYPTGTPGIDIKQELQKLLMSHCDKGSMTVYFGKILNSTDQMIARFKQCGISLPVVSFDDERKVVSAVTRGVRSSIYKTMSVARSIQRSDSVSVISEESAHIKRTLKLKRYSVVAALPPVDEWETRPTARVKLYRSQPIQSLSDLKAPVGFGIISFRRGARTDTTKKSTMLLRCAESAFVEGETRISFHGRLAPLEEELISDKSSVVLKSFKYSGVGVNDLTQYLKEMEVSNIARYLSRLYNLNPPANCGQVKFMQVCVVEDLDDSKEEEGTRRFCAEMPFPSDATPFTQYSDATGYWNPDCLDKTLLRFSEFTYEATNGYLMVTNLQGVRRGGGSRRTSLKHVFKDIAPTRGADYSLTEPVILCRDVLRFGEANLGKTILQKCIDATRAIMKEKGW